MCFGEKMANCGNQNIPWIWGKLSCGCGVCSCPPGNSLHISPKVFLRATSTSPSFHQKFKLMLLCLTKATTEKQPFRLVLWKYYCKCVWGFFLACNFCGGTSFIFCMIKYLVQPFPWSMNAQIQVSENLRAVFKNCFHPAVGWINILETC